MWDFMREAGSYPCAVYEELKAFKRKASREELQLYSAMTPDLYRHLIRESRRQKQSPRLALAAPARYPIPQYQTDRFEYLPSRA